VRATGIDRSTLADMVARMIGKGLLERERSNTDARANTVRLTDKGRQELEAARPKVEAADKRILSLLPGGKREGFLTVLLTMARAGEAARIEEQPAAAKVLAEDEAQAKKKGKKAAKLARAGKEPKPPKPEKKKKKAKKAKKADEPESGAPPVTP
ncbi:MAG TPA: MarR family winged helix-turn-helix transcriptional regulator, partial [Caulobacteraceae bacterium]|nr:MarR family winged helix-turn-helix transcriptional regulator [Caulobacteraceae bacterium]